MKTTDRKYVALTTSLDGELSYYTILKEHIYVDEHKRWYDQISSCYLFFYLLTEVRDFIISLLKLYAFNEILKSTHMTKSQFTTRSTTLFTARPKIRVTYASFEPCQPFKYLECRNSPSFQHHTVSGFSH